MVPVQNGAFPVMNKYENIRKLGGTGNDIDESNLGSQKSTLHDLFHMQILNLNISYMNINVGVSEGRGQEIRKRLMRREEEGFKRKCG